jgi:hypothetical protein
MRRTQEAARFAVRAAVLRESRQRLAQRGDETGTEAPGRPGLKLTEVELQADDRETGVQRRTDIDRTIEDTHGGCSAES